VIICDTGPIVAAALQGDDHHHECVELFTGLHLAGRSLLVPATVVAEVGYMLAREAGARVEALFLTAVADGDFQLIDLTTADVRRAAQLVLTYGDMPLGTTDATVIALAERMGVREIATLDRRHFSVVRPSHVEALTLLPS
jgi:predicted nucleic acid-binding protein